MSGLGETLNMVLAVALAAATVLAGYFRSSARQAKQNLNYEQSRADLAEAAAHRLLAAEEARMRAREAGRRELGKMYDLLAADQSRTQLEKTGE